MAEELIRAACESANCKYPDMEAMANFKREVTPSVVIGLIDGLRHAKGMAAINDARANGAAETIQHLRDDIAELRAKLHSQGGEAVEVVAYIDDGGALYTSKLLEIMSVESDGCEPLMTVAQHSRIVADVRASRDAVLKVMQARKLLPKCAPAPDAELVELLRDASVTMSSAHESLFEQCLSNGITNAWGNPVDVSKINDLQIAAKRIDAKLASL